jgi:hypothetical protein
MECNKNVVEIINFNKFNDNLNKYNEETKGEFNNFFTNCDFKGGDPYNTKLNKYFFVILRCLIFSVITNEFFRELVFLLPPTLIQEIFICFIKLLKMLLIKGCLQQFSIIQEMCPTYINSFIDFLNNLEIIIIKLGPIIKNTIRALIGGVFIKDMYDHSKIYYFLLNNPEFINDIDYPQNTLFIVNKYNYPVEFLNSITNAIVGSKQPNTDGEITPNSTYKTIPNKINTLTYIGRQLLDEEELLDDNDMVFVEVDAFMFNDEIIYLNPIYTKFYINIGYLAVSYISEDEAKNEITRLLKNRNEMKKVLSLLELKYNFPESFMRNLSNSLGYGYKTTIIKSPEGIINETTSSRGGKLTKGKLTKRKLTKGKLTKRKLTKGKLTKRKLTKGKLTKRKSKKRC